FGTLLEAPVGGTHGDVGVAASVLACHVEMVGGAGIEDATARIGPLVLVCVEAHGGQLGFQLRRCAHIVDGGTQDAVGCLGAIHPVPAQYLVEAENEFVLVLGLQVVGGHGARVLGLAVFVVGRNRAGRWCAIDAADL